MGNREEAEVLRRRGAQPRTGPRLLPQLEVGPEGPTAWPHDHQLRQRSSVKRLRQLLLPQGGRRRDKVSHRGVTVEGSKRVAVGLSTHVAGVQGQADVLRGAERSRQGRCTVLASPRQAVLVDSDACCQASAANGPVQNSSRHARTSSSKLERACT